ncbi:Protein stoned-B [Nymphon striatum]|nr:Protein stoned-B [Nymphon striatum]
MSNPFLTDDPSDNLNNASAQSIAYDVFGINSQPVCDFKKPELKSNNPFITSDDDCASNLFDSADSGIQTKDLSALNGEDVSAPAFNSATTPDLFCLEETDSTNVMGITAPSNPLFSNQQISQPNDPFGCDISSNDPFGPVEPEHGGASDLLSSAWPRQSPILEQKDFEPVPPMSMSFMSDALSDNLSEDSLNLQTTEDNLEFGAIVTETSHQDEKESNTSKTPIAPLDSFPTLTSLNTNDNSNLFGNFDATTSSVPSIELTESENQPLDLLESGEEQKEDILEADKPVDDVCIEEAKNESSTTTATFDLFSSDIQICNASNEKEAAEVKETFNANSEAFDAFAAKFENSSTYSNNMSDRIEDAFDPFGSTATGSLIDTSDTTSKKAMGFSEDASFDPFLSMTMPPKNTPIKRLKETVKDSFDDDDDGNDFSVCIRLKMRDADTVSKLASEPQILPPVLPPPPKLPAYIEPSPPESPVKSRFNPFNKDSGLDDVDANDLQAAPEEKAGKGRERTESQDSGTFTPLFDDDISQPLEEFPPKYEGDGWEMMLRQPNKKKITGNRFWKKIYVRIRENTVLMLYNTKDDKDPFQELPLQPCYSLSEVGAQQYDSYGKIFTVKLQYVFYREKVGMRPGQISKVVQGHITSVGQLAKLGLPVEHSPQISQLLKLGSQNYKDLRTFVRCVEDSLFRLPAHRDRALQYKNEEIQISVFDEFFADVNKEGRVVSQQARVRLFFVAFLGGMPHIEIGLNDLERQGKEVVGRHDIIPVVTEEWIRLENCEFHSCVTVSEFENTKTVKLHPPDACLFELMRFRIRPPRNRELPLHLKISMSITGSKVEIRGDILVPGFHSRKHGQVPCEDIKICIPIPECWIYLFRVEKHFRYGSFKSAHRKAGKIKGLERIMGTGVSLDTNLIEVSTGQAKYEHAYNAIVWRIPRLPKEGQGAYCTHLVLCRLELTSFDQLPDTFEKYCDVEYVMPASTVSHTTVRSISVSNQNPPEKFVKYVARYQYKVEIDHNDGKGPTQYDAATEKENGANIKEQTVIEENEEQSDDDDSS